MKRVTVLGRWTPLDYLNYYECPDLSKILFKVKKKLLQEKKSKLMHSKTPECIALQKQEKIVSLIYIGNEQ